MYNTCIYIYIYIYIIYIYNTYFIYWLLWLLWLLMPDAPVHKLQATSSRSCSMVVSLSAWLPPSHIGRARSGRSGRSGRPGRPGGRAAGERAGLVDFNNYKTSNRLQDYQQTTIVPGALIVHKAPTRRRIKTKKWPKATLSQRHQQTTRLPSDYKTFDR